MQESTAIALMVCVLFGLPYSTCSAAEQDRMIIFKEPRTNMAMEGHVISTGEVPSEGSCRVKCYMEPNCVSINIGPLKEGKFKCELNDATDENEFTPALKYKASYTYLAIKNPCSSNPCLNGGTCQAGFTSKGFQCRCLNGFFGVTCGQTAKSCSHIKRLNPMAASGSYVIDPDGKGGLVPFNVFCAFTDNNGVGVTVISHDSENRTLVDGCDAAGCYQRDIHYTGASLVQLAGLIRVSSHCEQFIKYECYGSLFVFNNTRFGWWVSRDSAEMEYWGGATPRSGKCACGMNNSCADRRYGCNCDKNDEEWREDSGLLTEKRHLPVKQLRFGDVGVSGKGYNEMGYHTLGKLKCHSVTLIKK